MIRRLKQFYRSIRNRRNADQVGEGAELRGALHKRHPRSQIKIGKKSRIDGYLTTETPESRLTVGENSLVGPDTIIDCAASVTIGDNVLISYGCVIADADNHSLNYADRKDDLERWRQGTHDWSKVAKAPIRIEEGAWIGARSIILKGVTIGKGAVVGMGSVVTHDVPDFTVVAGNPARTIKTLERN